MKKIITTLVLAVATLGVAQAQEFKVGVKAGGLFSNAAFKKDTKEGITTKYNTGFKFGYQFGVLGEYNFNDKLGVEVDVLYAFQGAKFNSVEGGIEGETLRKIDIKNGEINTQMNVNHIWLKYSVAEGLRPKLGVNISNLIKTSLKGEFEGGGHTLNYADLKAEPKKKFDFGVGAGIEYNHDSGFFVEATYNYGLTELSFKEKGDANSESPRFKNSVIQLNVGYKF
ncbi:porin family protein [Capnocytophaga bilenii]